MSDEPRIGDVWGDPNDTATWRRVYDLRCDVVEYESFASHEPSDIASNSEWFDFVRSPGIVRINERIADLEQIAAIAIAELESMRDHFGGVVKSPREVTESDWWNVAIDMRNIAKKALAAADAAAKETP